MPKQSLKSAKSKTKGDKYEIIYVTKRVDTSIALLDSSEDTVVVEALIYLFQYANINRNNLTYIQQHGMLQKLLNLLNRSACVLRLTLKLLGVLLEIDEVMSELSQNTYDEKIIEISKMFVSSHDPYIKLCCVSMLSKLTDSDRIVSVIFNIALFAPIMNIIGKTEDMDLLVTTLELLLRLVPGLAALESFPQSFSFDVSILITLLNSHEKIIVHTSYAVIHKLAYYNLDIIQKIFRKAKLIETMLDIVMDSNKQEYHETALNIILDCMKSNETSDYFIETLEFLNFCQWVKTCDEKYLFRCILILEQLTGMPSRRQILFDLSVEESILSCLRSKEEKVLNKTCEAISNMVIHRYCCEEMLKPDLLKKLFEILSSKDQEETGNEMALKTILDFNRLNLNTLDMMYKVEGHKVLLGYFNKGIGFISEESFLRILEILYKMSLSPQFQPDIATTCFFKKLLELFQTASANTAISACEIMINFVNYPELRCVFLLEGGPQMFLERIRNPKDVKLTKTVLLFIYNSLVQENMVEGFLQNNLVGVFNGIPAHLKQNMPIADKILRLIYKHHLCLKFFETHRLDITDKIQNKFYLISGHWQGAFPVFKDLEGSSVSTDYVIYVVDYSFQLKYQDDNSVGSDSISPRKISSERTVSTLSKVSSSLSSYVRSDPCQVKYGKLSIDPFLPTYVCHVSRYLTQVPTTHEKVKVLAKYIDAMLCEPVDGYTKLEKVHHLQLHVEMLKLKLGTNMIPVGFLRLGGLCEKALIFKAMADKCCIPASLMKGTGSYYWNEVLLFDSHPNVDKFRLYVVDLINNIGALLVVGSRAANHYCNITASNG